MPGQERKPRWSPPYSTPLPDGEAARRHVARLRVVAYVLAAVMLVSPAVQFQYGTMRRAAKAAALAAASSQSAPAEAEAAAFDKTKGAVGRWRNAVRDFWAGHNIYLASSDDGATRMHPNMPFVVILLTPFAYLPAWAAAAVYNALKLAVIAAAVLMMVRVADHDGLRMPDWVVGLGLLWALKPIVGDIQHGNTNVFVLGAIVLHLWLYRRGSDVAAGGALAAAICLKMTPALFLLYWLYQRGWKVLAGAAAGLVICAGIVPVAAVGPQRASELTRTWLDNLIIPGAVKGEWYPIHVNQSASGVLGRYLLGEGQSGGDIYWGPDDSPYEKQEEHGWIAFVSLSPATAKWVVRAFQAVIVLLGAWAIGWRRLGRDDGRRALHYGLVAVGMMLLNQRTWDHHATVMLVLAVPAWYSIAYGRVGAARAWALGLTLAAGACLWLSSNGVFEAAAWLAGRGSKVGSAWADVGLAYGPVFYYFLLMFAAGVILVVSLRSGDAPYSQQRQRLGGAVATTGA